MHCKHCESNRLKKESWERSYSDERRKNEALTEKVEALERKLARLQTEK